MRLEKQFAILKDTCTESLEKLNEKLIIGNFTCGEEIFLDFDRKYKSLKEKEKEMRLINQVLLDYFQTLSNSVNSLYNEVR